MKKIKPNHPHPFIKNSGIFAYLTDLWEKRKSRMTCNHTVPIYGSDLRITAVHLRTRLITRLDDMTEGGYSHQ